MNVPFDDLYLAIREWAGQHGIHSSEQPLPRGRAAEFKGTSVTLNVDYSTEEKCYYLAHSLGSIAIWCAEPGVQKMFDELRSAKEAKESNPLRLEAAIDRFRAFEIESSEMAVWLLDKLGFAAAISPYTNFMRADLESMTQFQRAGRAPVWRIFFARWNEEVRSGKRKVESFHLQPMPDFQPHAIEQQQVLQEQGDGTA